MALNKRLCTRTFAIISSLLSFTSARRTSLAPLAANNLQFHNQQRLYSANPRIASVGNCNAGDFGLTTFANLPWNPRLATPSSEADSVERYDIAFLGAPFDTGTTWRPGARFGPSGIRRGSQLIGPDFNWDVYTHNNAFRDWATIVDCGDAPMTFLDNTLALSQLEQAHRQISSLPAKNITQSSVPRIVTLGGDHTTTLAALRSTIHHWGPVSVVHFDSHIDTWDPDSLAPILGTNGSAYATVNHGTFLHVAHQEGLLLNGTSIHAGIRSPAANKKYDWQNDAKCGFSIVTARDIDRVGIQGVINRIKDRVKDTNTYISVDIDVLDPAFAPGTGTPCVGGWSTRELLSILDGLTGLKVIGADVVEVAPGYDNEAETTGWAAAEVAVSLMTLMVETPVPALTDLESNNNR